VRNSAPNKISTAVLKGRDTKRRKAGLSGQLLQQVHGSHSSAEQNAHSPHCGERCPSVPSCGGMHCEKRESMSFRPFKGGLIGGERARRWHSRQRTVKKR
jgi:hypothetical protein